MTTPAREIRDGQPTARGTRRPRAEHPYRRPIGAAARRAFAVAEARRRRHGGPVVLDAGCGCGTSAARLAEAMPDKLVIGVERSAGRVRRAPARLPDNALLLRADLVDFWRLAHAADWRLAGHYLLYPNPYPKPGQRGRRWHGHPVFPAVVALGGRLELRSNWSVYAEELAGTLADYGAPVAVERGFEPAEPVSAFERKYSASGHTLYRVTADLERSRGRPAPVSAGTHADRPIRGDESPAPFQRSDRDCKGHRA